MTGTCRTWKLWCSGSCEKIERLQLLSAEYPNSQLEEHIAKLIEKIESSDARFSQLDKIERGLAELLLQIDRPPSAQPAEIDTLKRDVQRTQYSIEAVHGTLGQVVDRLSNIETGLRGASAQQAPNERPSGPEPQAHDARAPDARMATAAAPDHAASANSANANPSHANPARPTGWAPLETDLPPDYPIEPNHRSSPAERIAASQAALGNPLGTARTSGHPDADAKANFIAAARRAAQAASGQLTERADRRVPDLRRVHGDDGIPSNVLGNHARLLLVAASVVMVVLGSLQLFGFFSSPNSPVAAVPDEPTLSTASTAPAIELETAPATVPSRQPRMLAVEDVLPAPSAGILPPPEPFGPSPASPDLATSRRSHDHRLGAPAEHPAGIHATRDTDQ